MKTDRFADSIRRKLDSIRPDFSERDWVRMQAMLKQAGPLPNATPPRPRVFSGQAARLIAAGAAGTVLFLGTTLYQTHEVNRLRNSIRQPDHASSRVDSARTITTDTPVATRTDARPLLPGAPASGEQPSSAVIRDTVYIDRYIRVPAIPSAERQDRLARTPDAAPGQPTGERERTAEEPVTAENTGTRRQRSAAPDQPANVSGTTPVAGVGPAGSPPERPVGLRPQRGYSTDQPSNGSTGNPPAFPTGQSVATRAGSRAKATRGNGTTTVSRNGGNGSGSTGNGDAGTTGPYSTPVAGSAAATDRQRTTRTEVAGQDQPRTDPMALPGGESAGLSAIAAEPIQVQPVQLGTVAWEQRLMQRSRRMRPARTVVVGGPVVAQTSVAPEKPERQSVPSPVKVRIGVGSDVNGNLWHIGGFAELLAGRHLTFSAGLGQSTFNNGSYLVEDDFRRQNDKDFRREFNIDSRVFDIKRDILNIQLRTTRVVMPLTIGYRLPVSTSVTIIPTIGTILTLQSHELISFIYKQSPSFLSPYGPGSTTYGSANLRQAREYDVFTNVTLGTNVEWSKKHWGIQAGPILSITPQKDPDWISSLSGGIRARAFFQF